MMQGGRGGGGRGGMMNNMGPGRPFNMDGPGPMQVDQGMMPPLNPQAMSFQQGMPPVMPGFGMAGRPGQQQMPGAPPSMPPQGMPPMQMPPQQQQQQQQQQGPPQQQQQGPRPGPGPPGGMVPGPGNLPMPPMPGLIPGMAGPMGMMGPGMPGPQPPHMPPPFDLPMPQMAMGMPPGPQLPMMPPPHMQGPGQGPGLQQQQQPGGPQFHMQGVPNQMMMMRPPMGGGGPGRGGPRPPGTGMMPPAATSLQQIRGGTGYRAPGTQSAAPNAKEVKNDYCQQFVDTGARPQNYLRDSHLTDRYEEYPKMKELIRMKDQLVRDNVTPAYWLKADLRTLRLSPETFGTKFDVILIDPPWEEYVRRAPHAPKLRDREVWSWQDIMNLEIEAIADNPSFVFLWCGTAEGLDAGRQCFAKWGYRRVEDIVWIKTNKDRNPRSGYLQPVNQEPYSILVHTKEHCLMGMKGSLRRNQDGHVIHANCDTDIIVSEEPAGGSTEKPAELYEIIERFCMSKRRLELFGEEHNIREGWVTVGRSLPTSNFRPDVYSSHFRFADGRSYVENMTGGRIPRGAPILIPTPPEVEEARPKSPPNTRDRR